MKRAADPSPGPDMCLVTLDSACASSSDSDMEKRAMYREEEMYVASAVVLGLLVRCSPCSLRAARRAAASVRHSLPPPRA